MVEGVPEREVAGGGVARARRAMGFTHLESAEMSKAGAMVASGPVVETRPDPREGLARGVRPKVGEGPHPKGARAAAVADDEGAAAPTRFGWVWVLEAEHQYVPGRVLRAYEDEATMLEAAAVLLNVMIADWNASSDGERVADTDATRVEADAARFEAMVEATGSTCYLAMHELPVGTSRAAADPAG